VFRPYFKADAVTDGDVHGHLFYLVLVAKGLPARATLEELLKKHHFFSPPFFGATVWHVCELLLTHFVRVSRPGLALGFSDGFL
jgi:hypothetical protein